MAGSWTFLPNQSANHWVIVAGAGTFIAGAEYLRVVRRDQVVSNLMLARAATIGLGVGSLAAVVTSAEPLAALKLMGGAAAISATMIIYMRKIQELQAEGNTELLEALGPMDTSALVNCALDGVAEAAIAAVMAPAVCAVFLNVTLAGAVTAPAVTTASNAYTVAMLVTGVGAGGIASLLVSSVRAPPLKKAAELAGMAAALSAGGRILLVGAVLGYKAVMAAAREV